MRSSIDRLTALDELMLRASELWPQDIGALALLDGTNLLDPTGRFRIEAVREAIASRLHLVPRFRQLVYVPRRGLGGSLWVDAPAFDLSDHVRVLPLSADTGEAELLLATEQLRSRRLDSSRPLWEMWFLTGLPDNQVALFVRVHHAIADGMAAMATISAFLDTTPDAPAPPVSPWTPTRPPSAGALLADNLLRHLQRLAGALSVLARPRTTLRRLRAAWPATRELLAEAPAPETSLDRMVGPDRTLALIRTTLDQVQEVAHAHAVTVNDVLLAVTAGGLRALLRSRGEPVEDIIVRIYVPVSLRRRGRGPQQGNLIAQMVVPLPIGVSDPGRRLGQIAAETARRKARTSHVAGDAVPGPDRQAAAAEGRHPSAGERDQREPPRSQGAAVPCRGADARGVPGAAPHRQRTPRGGRAVVRGNVQHRCRRRPGRLPRYRRLRGGRARGAARTWHVDLSDPRPATCCGRRRRPCPCRPSRSSYPKRNDVRTTPTTEGGDP